jgi:uncharacterized protein YbjT (DUF2867 family)
MKVVLFGATGMVGRGVLRECLLDPDVELVLAVGRGGSGQTHAKLRELSVPDLTDYSAVETQLAGFDACFWCLGVSSAGMSEADYFRVTYDFVVAAAGVLAKQNPSLTFIFVSGAGTDSTERGRVMWARVKGRAENAIMRLPFAASYMFRPGFIQPLHGIRSRTRAYNVLYAVIAPIVPLLRRMFPRHVLTTESIGRAMLNVAKRGASKRILEAPDIAAAAA